MKPITCPHCHKPLSDDELRSLRGKFHQRMRPARSPGILVYPKHSEAAGKRCRCAECNAKRPPGRSRARAKPRVIDDADLTWDGIKLNPERDGYEPLIALETRRLVRNSVKAAAVISKAAKTKAARKRYAFKLKLLRRRAESEGALAAIAEAAKYRAMEVLERKGLELIQLAVGRPPKP
jgi:hypothetical protein